MRLHFRGLLLCTGILVCGTLIGTGVGLATGATEPAAVAAAFLSVLTAAILIRKYHLVQWK